MIKISPYNLNINFKSRTFKPLPLGENRIIRHTNPNGDTFEIRYKDDRLSESYKNGRLYKTYEYENENFDAIGYEFYNDDSYIPYQHLWHVDNKDIRKVTNHEDSKEHFFLGNDNNRIKDEPKLFAHITLDPVEEVETRNIVQFGDKEVKSFSSVDEAQEYFMEEYGIDTKFSSISEAIILKQAVDSFVPLNFENKGKRLFEGMVVRSDEETFKDDLYTYAQVTTDIVVDLPDELEEADTDIQIDFLIENPEKIACENTVLNLNPNAPYTPEGFKLGKASNFHPYRFYSSALTHELGHWLHTQSPLDFYLSEITNVSKRDKHIMKEVSNYAAHDYSEFVAEYISGRLEGNTYSSRVNKLYEGLYAPDLFNS